MFLLPAAVPAEESGIVDQKELAGAAEFAEFERLEWREGEKAVQFLIDSAAKGYPDACSLVAGLVDRPGFPLERFGTSRENARIELLKKASVDDLSAQWRLACMYRDGSEQVKNLVKARVMLRDVSHKMFVSAWDDYAEMCASGIGGDYDFETAYFFFSAMTEVIAPSSGSGEFAWERRGELLSKLDKGQAAKVLRELDEWFTENGKPYQTAGMSNQMLKRENELRPKLEAEHRARIAQLDDLR